MMHGGDRWPERARNIMDVTHDHRAEWIGPEPESAKRADKGEHDTLWETQMADLLKKYLAMHGDWQEVTSHRADSSSHSWEFVICQCALCQAAEKLVGHPSTPNG